MAESTRIAPPNSLVIVEDASGGLVPDAMDRSLVAATDSCLAISCLSEMDGETEFVLGMAQEVNPGDYPVFSGTLRTPTRSIRVVTTHIQTILQMSVPNEQTSVRIWANHLSEPDRVIIGVS